MLRPITQRATIGLQRHVVFHRQRRCLPRFELVTVAVDHPIGLFELIVPPATIILAQRLDAGTKRRNSSRSTTVIQADTHAVALCLQ